MTLTNRTLYKDGEWNTICLPFSLDATQLAESPLAGASIGAMRSYFELDGFSSETNGIKQFIMDYGEDDPTGIAVFSDYSENSEHSDNWFDLSGRKLDGKPATKGIYVNGGRKVTVK